jgi:molybdate transport system substrate-binding protein
VAVRAGTAKPDVRTVEAFKQLLLKADVIAMPASTSGIWMTTDLFPRLGIAGKVKTKLAPRGSDATRMVAAGEADLAVMPVSEILAATGVEFAGSIAPEIQFVQMFSAAIVAGSKAQAAAAIRDSGIEPVASSK